MLLIANGTLMDPKTHLNEKMDLLIENGKVIKIEKRIEKPMYCDVIDASGLVVSPGFIDLHVHLREPGFSEKETIYTGSRACAKGGYTTVVCMPNTNPALDSVETLEVLSKIVDCDSIIEVLPAAAITKGIAGQALTDHKALFHSGAVALSDDGRTTMSETFMREAFRASRVYGKPVMTHSEDHDVTMHLKEDIFPTHAESDIVIRDIRLCEEENGILHVSHVSTKEAVKAIEAAQKKGLCVTGEAAPHHFALDDKKVDMKSTFSKVNPPIRSEEDRLILIDAIKKGVISAIATDHAPHEAASKMKPYGEASFGISGIESAFSVSYASLVETGEIDLMTMLRLLTENPAQIAGLTGVGSLEVGVDANIAILDIEKEVVIDSTTFVSKGKNTPFDGFRGKGEVVATLYKGKVVYSSRPV